MICRSPVLVMLFICASLGTAAPAAAQAAAGSFARIAVLRPHNGDTIDFEAGYMRHLEWHRQAKDTATWYGWTIWAGERQRWFVYATFGHAIASFDHPVAPADDERDNVLNVTPHAEFVGNGLYQYLPSASQGTGIPSPLARLELTTVDLHPGAAAAFETALESTQPSLRGESLWYRLVAGGSSPRYIRMRPRPTLEAIVEATTEAPLPDKVGPLITKLTVEILNLRPTMSYGLPR
jgi:hypothetical protein